MQDEQSGVVGDRADDPELSGPAAFDAFAIRTFGHLVPAEQLGELQALASGFCLGLFNTTGLPARVPADLQKMIEGLTDDDCAVVSNGSPLFDRPLPPSADSWEQVINARFERTIWWFDEDAFEARALRACVGNEGITQLMSDQLLSQSVVVELNTLVSSGQCDLADRGSVLEPYGERINEVLGDSRSDFTDAEVQCINDTTVQYNTSGAYVPVVVIWHFVRVCAPDMAAQIWVDSGAVGLSPPDDYCFARTIVDVANEDVWRAFDWWDNSRMDPPSEVRNNIDEQLQLKCGIDEAQGVEAGLRNRGKLEADARLIAYCAAVASRETTPGYGPGADAETTVAWLERELTQFRPLDPPPDILTEHLLRIEDLFDDFGLAIEGLDYDEIAQRTEYPRYLKPEEAAKLEEFEATNCS